jgi:hypothetical protein
MLPVGLGPSPEKASRAQSPPHPEVHGLSNRNGDVFDHLEMLLIT